MEKPWPSPARCAPLVLAPAIALVMSCGGESVVAPSPITAGTISKSPDIVGLVYATTFTFEARGFSSADQSSMTYDWELGDESPFADPTRMLDATATVTQTYISTGVFVVKATAKNRSGGSATATLRGIQVVSLSGIWGVRDAQGNFVVRNTSLAHNKEGITGDDTGLNCRFVVTGSVAAPRGVTLAWSRPERDCQGRGLPVSFSFSGSLDNSANSIVGTLNDGRPVTISRCARLSCF
jgi:hypothetical protein